VGEEWCDHRTLDSPPITDGQDPVFQNTRLEPFLDQADHACVIDPMLQETHQPLLADRIEEASEVRVKNIVHLCAVDSGDKCVQRIVLAALGPEPIREAEEVFLVDRVQHRACRLLDDLVFECGNCERALLTISLRYVMSPRRQSPICSPMDPGVQVLDLAIEVCLVVLHCQPIHTRCGISLEGEECHPEECNADVLEERGEPFLLPLPCDRPYAA